MPKSNRPKPPTRICNGSTGAATVVLVSGAAAVAVGATVVATAVVATTVGATTAVAAVVVDVWATDVATTVVDVASDVEPDTVVTTETAGGPLSKLVRSAQLDSTSTTQPPMAARSGVLPRRVMGANVT